MNFLHTYDGKDDYFTVTLERTRPKANDLTAEAQDGLPG